jgi:hypothetical protein
MAENELPRGAQIARDLLKTVVAQEKAIQELRECVLSQQTLLQEVISTQQKFETYLLAITDLIKERGKPAATAPGMN